MNNPQHITQFHWKKCLEKYILEKFMLSGCCSQAKLLIFMRSQELIALVRYSRAKDGKSNFCNYLSDKFVHLFNDVKFVCKGGRGSGDRKPQHPHKTAGYLEYSGIRSHSVNGIFVFVFCIFI